MDTVAATYKGIKTYAENAEFTVPGERTAKVTVVWSKPNRLRASGASDSGVATAICDGKSLYATTVANKTQYLRIGAPADVKGIKEKLQRKGVPIIFTAAPLLAGVHPLQAVKPFLKKLSLDGPATLNGIPVDQVVAHCARGDFQWTTTYAIGKADHLLYGETTQWAQQGKTATIVEVRTKVQLNPPVSNATFSFVPPAGARAARSLVPSNADPRLEEGARPFPFVATAVDGKPLSLEQYRGRVLLLDFWATWCGPCVASLPEVQAIYRKFRRTEFDIVGVSLDQERPQLMSFLKERQIPWRQIFEGNGWQGQVPRQYGVQAIPFTLLIGRDGRIIGMNLMGPDLEDAIREATRSARR